MAVKFEEELKDTNGATILDMVKEPFNEKVAKESRTDAMPQMGGTGREYLKEIGYFDAAEKFYMVDYKPYLDLFPATSKNFGVIILDPNQDENSPISFNKEDVVDKPQLVFQQVFCEVAPNDVKEVQYSTPKSKMLYYFKGIYLVTKGDDGQHHMKKLWDVFIFNPNKEYKK